VLTGNKNNKEQIVIEDIKVENFTEFTLSRKLINIL